MKIALLLTLVTISCLAEALPQLPQLCTKDENCADNYFCKKGDGGVKYCTVCKDDPPHDYDTRCHANPCQWYKDKNNCHLQWSVDPCRGSGVGLIEDSCPVTCDIEKCRKRNCKKEIQKNYLETRNQKTKTCPKKEGSVCSMPRTDGTGIVAFNCSSGNWQILGACDFVSGKPSPESVDQQGEEIAKGEAEAKKECSQRVFNLEGNPRGAYIEQTSIGHYKCFAIFVEFCISSSTSSTYPQTCHFAGLGPCKDDETTLAPFPIGGRRKR